jgi:hypothetical protein
MSELTLEQQQAIAIAQARARAADTNPVPLKGSGVQPTTPAQTDQSALVNFLSGGKSANLEQYLYGNETPADTFLGKAGQLLDASGITGLTGIAPVGQLGSAVTAVGSKIPNVSPYVSKATNYVAPIAEKAKELPARFLGFMSGKDPKAYSTIYNAYKEGNSQLKQAIQEATPLGQQLYDDMIYNYARKLQVPHEAAMRAKDYTRGHPENLGAWDLADLQYSQFPDLPAAIARQQVSAYKPFSQLTDAEKLKQATQAGVDTATWNPMPPKSGKALSLEDLRLIGKKLIVPILTQNPIISTTASPRVSRGVAMAAGKTANIAGKTANIAGKAGANLARASNVLPDPTLEDLFRYGLLTPYLSSQGQ